jgi:hypothetical protein
MSAAENSKRFTNRIRRGETLTTGYAYVNSITKVKKGDEDLWFISLGLQSGWQPGDQEDKPKPVYQNIDLLIGQSLLEGEYTKETGKLYGFVQIRNLVFIPKEGTDTIFLNTRGILESITFGQLDE